MSNAITQLPVNVVDSSKVSGWDKVFQDELAKCFPRLNLEDWSVMFAYMPGCYDLNSSVRSLTLDPNWDTRKTRPDRLLFLATHRTSSSSLHILSSVPMLRSLLGKRWALFCSATMGSGQEDEDRPDDESTFFPLLDTKGWDIQFAYRHNLESPCAAVGAPYHQVGDCFAAFYALHLPTLSSVCVSATKPELDKLMGEDARLFYPDARIPVSRRETEQETP